MPQVDGYYRVSPRRRCPICGKPDWCLVAHSGDTVICPRVSYGAERHIEDVGYLHRLTPERKQAVGPPPRPSGYEPPTIDAQALAIEYEEALPDDVLAAHAAELGLKAGALRRMGLGWCAGKGAFTFPMRDGGGKIIGIRLRYRDGRKRAITGSRAGLFVPEGFRDDDTVLICEGPTDTAALVGLGFDGSIGRPACRGGTAFLKAMARRHWNVAILSDTDEEGWGQAGAEALADALVGQVRSVRVIEPLRGKDSRAWVNAGVTRELVINVIRNVGYWQFRGSQA